jgi:hypothetical protein
MKNDYNYEYWDPGDPLPARQPENVEFFEEDFSRWTPSNTKLREWSMFKRRWPLSRDKSDDELNLRRVRRYLGICWGHMPGDQDIIQSLIKWVDIVIKETEFKNRIRG